MAPPEAAVNIEEKTNMARKHSIPVVALQSPAGKRLLAKIESQRTKRDHEVVATVAGIIEDIRKAGDKALCAYTQRFDSIKLTPASLRLEPERIAQAAAQTPHALRHTIREAAKRIRAFHRLQKPKGFRYRSGEGVLEQLVRPLDRVGVYVTDRQFDFLEEIYFIPNVFGNYQPLFIMSSSNTRVFAHFHTFFM